MLSFFVSYIHIFCYLNLEEQNTKLKILTFYTIMLVENVLLITLWTLGDQSSVYGWDRTRVFIAVFASFFLGLFFMVIYYRYFHVRKLSTTLTYNPSEETAKEARKTPRIGPHDPAVTVFNCALNPAIRKKKKLPSRSAPPPPLATPFWKEPLDPPPPEERTAGDGLSYSRTTSVDDIRAKLAEKREKQLLELRRIEKDIASGRIERPDHTADVSRSIPGTIIDVLLCNETRSLIFYQDYPINCPSSAILYKAYKNWHAFQFGMVLFNRLNAFLQELRSSP